jgi:hypothetical protein
MDSPSLGEGSQRRRRRRGEGVGVKAEHQEVYSQLSGIVDRAVVVTIEAGGLSSCRNNYFVCVSHNQWKALDRVFDFPNYLPD